MTCAVTCAKSLHLLMLPFPFQPFCIYLYSLWSGLMSFIVFVQYILNQSCQPDLCLLALPMLPVLGDLVKVCMFGGCHEVSFLGMLHWINFSFERKVDFQASLKRHALEINTWDICRGEVVLFLTFGVSRMAETQKRYKWHSHNSKSSRESKYSCCKGTRQANI